MPMVVRASSLRSSKPKLDACLPTFTRRSTPKRECAPSRCITRQTTRDWRIPAAWLTLCVVWSSTWLVIKIGLLDLPPVSFVAWRFVIAVLALLVISVGRTRLLPPRRSDYLVLGFTGVLMFSVNYALLFWAELHVSSGLAAVIQASIPIFGMVFAHWMLPEEPLRWQRLAGALVAIFGVALICARLLSFNGWLAFLGGLGITVGAASAAFSNVLLKARRMQLAPSMLAAWQMIFGVVPLLFVGLTMDGNPLHLHWTGRAILCLLYLAVIGSSFTFLLLYWLMPRMSVTNLQTISLITPPGAIAIGWAFGGERLSALVARWRGVRSPRRLDDFPPDCGAKAQLLQSFAADCNVGGAFVPRFSQRKACSHLPRLAQAIVEAAQEMRYRLLRFVAHIGEAERLALELSVPAIDHQMMLLAQVAHQLCHIDAAVVFHAGERDGAASFDGEKFEAAIAHPAVNKRVGPARAARSASSGLPRKFPRASIAGRKCGRCSESSVSCLPPAVS